MKNIYSDLKILLSKDLFKIYLLFFASLLSTLLEVVSIGSIPVFVMMITDLDLIFSKISQIHYLKFILNFEHSKVVIFGAIALMFIFLFKKLYLFLLLFFQGKLIMKLRAKTSNNIFSHYISWPYEKFINRNPAILIRTIESDIGNSFNYIQSLLMLVRESLILISLFLLLIFANPFISSISILSLGIPVLFFYYFYRNKLKVKGKLLQIELGKKLKTINQSLGSFKELKIMRRENFFLNNFKEINLNSEKLSFFSYIITSTPRLFLEVTALLSVVIVSAFLYIIENNAQSIIPLISLLSVTAIRLIPALSVITSSLTTLRFKRPSFELIVDEIKELKKSLELQSKQNLNKENYNKKFEFNNQISLENISFSYFDVSKVAVENINFKVKKGSKVGIIGRSGSGKSTLVDLILGLLKPQKGEIYLDNHKIDEVSESWQSQVGYIQQDIYLLDDTIKNNISFGIEKDKIDEKLINKVIKIAQLEKFINSLPNRLDTIIGNRGTKISGGERQRIAIARALYNNPQIIILDEATSALDTDNENKILNEINENLSDKTMIVISHRNNTVKNCDTIFVMENGKIIDNGSFPDVMSRNSFLREIN